jgi:hypothetical protein
VVAVCVCPPSLRDRVERAARKVGAASLTCKCYLHLPCLFGVVL